MDAIVQINNCKYLFLDSIEELPGNNLRLVIREGRATGPVNEVEVGGGVIKDVQAVLPYADSAWEIFFERYVAYSVRNESYTTLDPQEIWEGHLFRTYSKSRFLDYVRVATFACNEYPGTLRHDELVCADHIVDVVAVMPPAIRRAEPPATDT
jgi:hypothetical protein